MITVEVVHARPERAWRVRLRLPEGATVGDAIRASGFSASIPDLRVDDDHVGVYARPRTLASPLRDGDRVEIYRPLVVDPKAARRRRAG